jgi:hypothetical protein
MKPSSLALAALSLPMLAMAWGAERCALAAPPKDAAMSVDDGAYYFVYPRSIDAGFSGCQTMWDEAGRKMLVLTFVKGVLTQYQQLPDPRGAGAGLVCRYAGGVVTAGGGDCPDYASSSTGLPVMPQSDEPAVPAGRDPRK